MASSAAAAEPRPLIIESNLSKLTPEELTFFKVQTGINDEDTLKKHIREIQTEALKVSLRYRSDETNAFNIEP